MARPITRSFRTPIPQTHAWPTNLTALDEAVVSAGASQVHRVHFAMGSPDGVVLRAWYYGEAGYQGMPDRFMVERGTVHVAVFSVPREVRQACKDALIAEGLPALGQWLYQGEVAGSVWRAESHSWAMKYVDGRLSLCISWSH